VNRLTNWPSWFFVLTGIVFSGGMLIAVMNATPTVFWTNLGFMLAGTSLGVGSAIWIIQRVLDYRQDRTNREVKVKLLRSIGGDCVGAITRIYPPIGSTPFVFRGKSLVLAWQDIVNGEMSSDGFRLDVYGQYQQTVYSDEDRQSKSPLPERVVLSNMLIDFDIGLLMVTRALGRAYARFDLFDLDELPINALESAAATLRNGKSKGTLTDFEGAMLLSPLG